MAKKLTSTKAKKILHDKTVHGKPLTDKQRRFFGAVASGAIPQAQNGIEGTMGGLTDIGFNYNGAWGGTMQMGGGLPGAVGFTYARTAGAAPANGPYAKKTKASAQKGKAITKREDFEPWWNWASRKAGDVDKRQDAFGTLGDLYAYYAGQPLRYNVLENSEYKPTNAKDPNAKYISINDPKFKQEVFDKYNDVFIKKELGKGKLQAQKINDNTYSVSGYTPATRKQFEEAKKLGTHPVYMKGKDYVSNAIGRYFISKGKDEKGDYISYYDTFDEGSGPDGGGIGEMLKLTKPFEIYDRIYLDPKTGKPKLKDGGSMSYYQAGLDFKPKTISQDGSIISPLGQWAYPGEITTIPSNQITMQGVPYPVLGISDVGDTQMMYPGEDYTFDGDYVTEYPMAKGGISVNEADAQPIKKLDQLLNFTNYNDMAKAKKGKKLPKAQGGFEQALGSLNTNLGSMGGISGASGQLLGGIQTLIEEGKQRKKTQQALALSDITTKAATTRPVGIERKYVRPEDMLVEPGQIGSPYGTGFDFLQMEDGGFIGGNPTEIQNMYNPGDLYSDLGYEPLEDSTKVKQFRKGGKAFYGMDLSTTGTTTTMAPMNPVQFGQIGSTLGSFIGGGRGEQSGAGQVGSAVGGIAGNILLPGVGGVVGSALGGLIGGAIGGQSQKAMEQKQRRIQGNLGTAAFQQSLQGQFSGFMEHGGELKYLSHTWQPQTITKFGEYDVKDLLAPPKDADMLRAGGHLKEYTAPSEAAMSTERPAMQMGGELQTYWGGYAEPISYNPYLPDGGETVMFRGQSHDESDGKGRTGIGITYGNSPVEVERGEPAVKLRDGGTGDKSLVVFGNMQIPSYGASELNDPKAKGMKFKKYAEGLSKIETKANKTSEKALKILDSTDGSSPFDMLSMSTANIMMKGSDMKLKEAAMKKQLAAGIQSAILDTAEEMGVENDALAKGKIKPMKKSNMAKFGAKMETAQRGVKKPIKIDMKPFMPTDAQTAAQDAAFRAANREQPISKFDSYRSFVENEYPVEQFNSLTKLPTAAELKAMEAGQPKDKSGFRLMDFARELRPYIRPLIQNRLDPAQFAPEMMALATNVVEPVQAQQFTPRLEEVPTISLQDQLNEIQAEANAARRMAGNNPAAQAAIASQAAAAKNKVLGEQTRMNQMMQLESRRKNLATLNQATLTNLDILGQQYERQARAKSITKAQAQEALQSIAEKIGRNKAETLQANIMSNMYPQFTFGPKGRIFTTDVADINIPTVAADQTPTDTKGNDLLPIYGKKGNITGYKVKENRNGSIVKAIKNL